MFYAYLVKLTVIINNGDGSCLTVSLDLNLSPPGTMMTLIVSFPSMTVSSKLVRRVNVSFSVLLALYVNLGAVSARKKSLPIINTDTNNMNDVNNHL